MTESQMFLNTTAALLVVAVLTHSPWLMTRLGRESFFPMAMGTLVPLLDILVFGLLSEDRIGFLVRPSIFSAIPYGLAFNVGAAILTGFWFGQQNGATRGIRVFFWLSAGHLLWTILSIVTPTGNTPLSPILGQTLSMGFLPDGHLPLMVTLAIALAVLEWRPRWNFGLLITTWGLVGIYTLGGLGQHAWFHRKGEALSRAGETVFVEPADPWMTRWHIVLVNDQKYLAILNGLTMPEAGVPEDVPRWNDRAVLTSLLRDPVVNHFFNRKFRHPVARTEIRENRLTLYIQELRDFAPGKSGPQFAFELEYPDKRRMYSVNHFD